MTASDLHNLIVASGLPVEKWPLLWASHLTCDNPTNFFYERCGYKPIELDRVSREFTAVLVEELLSSTMHPDMPTGAAIGWTLRKFRNGRYDVGLKYEADTLLEALCAAYQSVHRMPGKP